ncbi:hypothetical protein ES708_05956 [subsurface metagenome]
MNETPNYIKTLLTPSSKSPRGRRVWSIDLESVWLPFFTATNVMGDTAIPLDALGAPIRLAYNKDGSVRFGRTGRPITKVAKPISDTASLVRQNFVANLLTYSEQVATAKKQEYAKLVGLCAKAGHPIITHDEAELSKAVQLQIEEAMREAQELEAKPEAQVVEPAREAVTA